MLKTLFTIIFIFVLTFIPSFADEFDVINQPSQTTTIKPVTDTIWDDYIAIACGLGYVYNENSEIISLNLDVLRLTNNKKLEYRVPLFPIGLVKRESGSYRYSFQTPVTLVAFGLGAAVHKLLYPADDYKILERPDLFTKMLLAPNSSVQYHLSESTLIGLATQTDYLFYRDQSEARGILFTPSLTFTIIKQNMLIGRGGFTVALAHSNFLSFDGDNQTDGFGVRVYFYGDVSSH